MKRSAMAVLALVLCCTPALADQIIGSSVQDVVLKNMGGGVIGVLLGPLNSPVSATTPYALSATAPSPLLFKQSGGTSSNIFIAESNSFQASVGAFTNEPASYRDMHSNDTVVFDGVGCRLMHILISCSTRRLSTCSDRRPPL
jgi:hypothetical protein